jgi:hypothetical protein
VHETAQEAAKPDYAQSVSTPSLGASRPLAVWAIDATSVETSVIDRRRDTQSSDAGVSCDAVRLALGAGKRAPVVGRAVWTVLRVAAVGATDRIVRALKRYRGGYGHGALAGLVGRCDAADGAKPQQHAANLGSHRL